MNWCTLLVQKVIGMSVSIFQQYEYSDLVLIGPNIPHLNFDYGVQCDYRKVVVHLNQGFVEQHFSNVPEFTSIQKLFEESKKGVAFSGITKELIGKKLFKLEDLNPFKRYIWLMGVLQSLSESEDIERLHDKPFLNKINNNEKERLRLIYSFVDENYQHKIRLDEIAEICFMTKESFCRYFKKKQIILLFNS